MIRQFRDPGVREGRPKALLTTTHLVILPADKMSGVANANYLSARAMFVKQITMPDLRRVQCSCQIAARDHGLGHVH